MQRGVATALAFLFSWLLIAPVFAAPTALSVPPCCRKTGSHQCAMHSGEGAQHAGGMRTVEAKCPFANGSLSVVPHLDSCSPATRNSVYAALLQHPPVPAQTEANFRISYDRSRQKRGPPLPILG